LHPDAKLWVAGAGLVEERGTRPGRGTLQRGREEAQEMMVNVIHGGAYPVACDVSSLRFCSQKASGGGQPPPPGPPETRARPPPPLAQIQTSGTDSTISCPVRRPDTPRFFRPRKRATPTPGRACTTDARSLFPGRRAVYRTVRLGRQGRRPRRRDTGDE